MAAVKNGRRRKAVAPAVLPPLPPTPTSTPSGPMSEIGLTGLRYWTGRIDEEFLTELKWDKARKIYREMSDNDPTIGSLLNAITLLIRQVEWRFEAASDTDDRVDFLESNRDDMSHSWGDLLSEIARGTLIYGWQFHEIVYKIRQAGDSQYTDGKIGWKKLPVRAQDTLWRWDFDERGGMDALVQMAPPYFRLVQIPIEKGLLFRTETFKNNPEGRSILRNAYRPWYFKRNIENIEGIGLERDLAGLPVLYAPARLFGPGASTDDTLVLAELKEIVVNIKRDEQEGVLLPMVYDDKGQQLYKLELLTTGGQRQFNTTEVINRYDLRILQLILADFIQVGHENVGSRALATTKTDIFLFAIGLFLDQIASVFNRYAVPRLLELNGMPVEDAPELVHSDLNSRNLDELGNYLKNLAAIGMPLFPNPALEATLLEFADLPVPTPEEQAAAQAQQAQDAAAQAAAQAAVTPAPPAAAPAPASVEPAASQQKRFEPTIIKVEPSVTVQQAPVHVEVHPSPVAVGAPAVTVEAPEPILVPPASVTVEKTEITNLLPAPIVQASGPVAITNVVEAAKAADVQVTVEPTIVNVPAVESPTFQVFVPPAEPVIHVEPQVVSKQGDVIVNLDTQPVVDAIAAAADKLKRPAVKIIRDAAGRPDTLEPST